MAQKRIDIGVRAAHLPARQYQKFIEEHALDEQADAFERLMANDAFIAAVAELNDVVSRPGETIEGNVFYENLDTLRGVPINMTLARFRRGFTTAVNGRNRFFEIGFNAGHSALLYLFINPRGIYTGVDLAHRRYTDEAIAHLSKKYPDRFNITVGDSTVVLPSMIENKVQPFDAIHVDGGHTYEVAYADIMNSLKLIKDDGIILVDDRPAPEVGRAIDASINTGLLKPHEIDARFKDGFQAYLQKA